MPLIGPITCPQCKQSGWPGDNFQTETDSSGTKLYCRCGQIIPLASPRDYNILSTNIFVRLHEASNHIEHGSVELLPGHVTEVKFKRQFDFPCKAYLTPNASIMVKEYSLLRDGMTILSSFLSTDLDAAEQVAVTWMVFGLINVDNLPTWYVLFYAAITDNNNGLFKAALLNYAVAFEAFVEEFLRERLAQRYDEALADFLLEKVWRIKDRCSGLLFQAIGHRLSEEDEIYQPWHQHVQTLRNRLMHGENVIVGKKEAERAHHVTYQAIRWVQNHSQQ